MNNKEICNHIEDIEIMLAKLGLMLKELRREIELDTEMKNETNTTK